MLVLTIVAMEIKQSLRGSLQRITIFLSSNTSSQDIKLRNAAFILSTCASVIRLHALPSFSHLQLSDLIHNEMILQNGCYSMYCVC